MTEQPQIPGLFPSQEVNKPTEPPKDNPTSETPNQYFERIFLDPKATQQREEEGLPEEVLPPYDEQASIDQEVEKNLKNYPFDRD